MTNGHPAAQAGWHPQVHAARKERLRRPGYRGRPWRLLSGPRSGPLPQLLFCDWVNCEFGLDFSSPSSQWLVAMATFSRIGKASISPASAPPHPYYSEVPIIHQGRITKAQKEMSKITGTLGSSWGGLHGLFLQCLENDLWPMARERVLPPPGATMGSLCEALSPLSGFFPMLTYLESFSSPHTGGCNRRGKKYNSHN